MEEESKSDLDIKSIHFSDPKCGLSLVPNKTVTYKTDEFEVKYSTSQIPSTNFGYRTDSINEKPEEFTSIFLGDSFTFGLGVDYRDTFFYLYKEALSLKNIINVSVSGIDTYEYFLKISCYLDMFPIEKIYLVIYLGNDLFPTFNSLQKVKKRKRKKESLKRKLAIYRLIKGLKHRNKSYEMFNTKTIDTFWNYTSPFKFLEYDAEKSIAYKEYKEFLEKIIILCGIRKTKLYVILIPDKIQVYEDKVKEILKNPTEYNFDKPNKYTSIICKQYNIPVFDATSYLKKVAKDSSPDKIYYDYDIHFNSLGHKAMADYLLSTLK
ncbi:MAG: SGNH/GDSL hydrolase family protein [Candidatus Anammoxibacter sp.]